MADEDHRQRAWRRALELVRAGLGCHKAAQLRSKGAAPKSRDAALVRWLRHHVDERPTYGYRCIRAQRPPARPHPRRQSSGHGLEPAVVLGRAGVCLARNGEAVRMGVAIDAHDREVIAWRPVVGGRISSSEVRDMMPEAVEKRFGAIWALHAV
jgi:putative transposase